MGGVVRALWAMGCVGATLAGCESETWVPSDALIDCSRGSCPPGFVCNPGSHLCQPEDAEVLTSSPTLTLPVGQTRAKNGDELVVGGEGAVGAQIYRARLVDVADRHAGVGGDPGEPG